MNKQQAIEKVSVLKKELSDLEKIINSPELSAEQWMVNFLNENAKKWRVEMGDGSIVYYLGDQWIFQLDLKNKYFWCYYYKVWEIFYKQYRMDYGAVQQLMRNVVLKAFNCEGFTPKNNLTWIDNLVLKAFNCEGFTPLTPARFMSGGD